MMPVTPSLPQLSPLSWLLAYFCRAALVYPYEELLVTDEEENFTLFRSSGLSSNSFYWPQLKSTYRSSPVATRKSLEEIFSIDQKKTLAKDEPGVKIIQSASEVLPDLIAVRGRADSCLIIGAANLMEYMLDEAVKNEDLSDILTGLYRARILYEENQQYLSFDLESIQKFCNF